jgi:ligand-binding sensor domain-containing protein/signal transduction histidine kinase
MRSALRKQHQLFFGWVARLCALLTLVCPCLAAQLPVKIYTVNDGLPQDRIKHIVQDSRGFLWFSTAAVSRFDGQQFINFGINEGLPYRSVNALLETRNGAYWVATNGGGIARFNVAPSPLSQVWQAQPVGARFVVYGCGDNAASQRVNTLFEDRAGNIWAGTDNGLFWLRPGQAKFEQVAQAADFLNDRPLMVWAFAEDAAGSLWIGTNVGLLRRLPDGRMALCNNSPANTVRTVQTLLFDPQGRLWIGYRNGLVVLRPLLVTEVNVADKVPWRKLQRSAATGLSLPEIAGDALWLTAEDGLSADDVLALAQAPNGYVWIGSSLGLSSFDGRQLRRYTKEELPLRDSVQALAVDRAGYLWIGTNTSGVLKLSLSGFVRYGESDGLNDPYITRLGEDERGRLFAVGTQWQIYSFDGLHFTKLRPNLPARLLQTEQRLAFPILRDHLGEWWVSTNEGIYRFPRVADIHDLARVQPLAVYSERDGLIRTDTREMFEDAQGDLWFAVFAPGREILTRWERATGRFIRYGTAHGLPAHTVMSFADDGLGGMWFGFRDGGLARFANGQFTVLTAADGLPQGDVNALHRDRQGRLWAVISPDGFGQIENLSAARPRYVRHPTLNEAVGYIAGLSLIEDDVGRLYFYPGRGLARFDPQTNVLVHYGAADGTTNHMLRSGFRDRQGALWFGTEGSLLRLLPTPDRRAAPPAVFISALRVAGVEYNLPPGGALTLQLPDLVPEQRNLDIEFLGLSSGSGDLLRFQYWLEGADAGWSEPTEQRRIAYANLAPGSYRFTVRAIGTDGLLSQTDAALNFTILPPVYRRWWFIALVVATVLVALYSFERYRVARLLELEHVRMRIATDLHDDIGAGLSRIAILSEVAHGRLGTGDLRGRDHMMTIAGASRELLDSMGDIVWAINPQKEQLKDLLQRMRRFANDLLSARNITLRILAPDTEQDLKLGVDVRREVFLIFKEGINNLAKHSGATEAIVELQVDGRWLRLKIADNGRGFDAATLTAQAWQSDGNGLQSMRNRAKRLGGELQIVSTPGQGTTIHLHVPLQLHWWEEKPQPIDPRRRKLAETATAKPAQFSWLTRLTRLLRR